MVISCFKSASTEPKSRSTGSPDLASRPGRTCSADGLEAGAFGPAAVLEEAPSCRQLSRFGEHIVLARTHPPSLARRDELPDVGRVG
jgi:hypothetical protein